MRVLIIALAMFASILAQAKDFPIFDGQRYNGQIYPRIDLIEWADAKGEPTHLEFHFYSKDKPMDLALQVGEKSGRRVVWLNYNLKFRGERACRHAPSPEHFSPETKLYTYRDNSNPEYDNLYVTSIPMKTTKTLAAVVLESYYICPNDETASNMPSGPLPPGVQPERAIASVAEPVPASATTTEGSATVPDSAVKRDAKGLNVDYQNDALPFSF